jgi:hypothetical protein
MVTMNTRILLGMSTALLSVSAFGQSTASASGSATAHIFVPIAITPGATLAFGKVAPTASNGTLVLATDNSVTPTNVTAIAGSTTTAGSFNVTGEKGAAFSVTLPSSTSLSDGASHSMTVDTFTIKWTNNTNVAGSLISSGGTATLGTLVGGGAAGLAVGGTLHVNSAQAAGDYTGSYNVDVAYQ